MSWLRGAVALLCYFALTNGDVGGSQMVGASFLITVHVKRHWTVDDDGGGRRRAPWQRAWAASPNTTRSVLTGPAAHCVWVFGCGCVWKCTCLKPLLRFLLRAVISRFHYSVLTDICPLKSSKPLWGLSHCMIQLVFSIQLCYLACRRDELQGLLSFLSRICACFLHPWCSQLDFEVQACGRQLEKS